MGFCVFAITNGMKLDCTWPIVPWVLAFSPLPTVENGNLRRPEHRGFLRFCDYQRYEIGLHEVDRTGGFGVFAITNGTKRRFAPPRVPWVLAFLPLPTVENGDLRHRAYRGSWRFRNYQR
ncbi:hypothetical protein [Levyella massiliensis]|uniref:hypothetical protein n=1 Tax=Levyella massiliensis TaxID=938289 RepID=UPI00036D6BF0|nr:hypothetical protein [Levyella massiliensis]